MFSRRTLCAAAVAGTALASMQEAVAQTDAGGGDWMAMVQAHHAMIDATFKDLLATRDNQAAQRRALHQRLAYQLTAHSVAEENVLYPGLAMHGLKPGSDKLYHDQAQAKVINAELDMAADKGNAAWLEKVRTLQAAVLQHAKQDEEGDLYPKLKQASSAEENAKMTAAYRREFARVRRA
jgi:hemerythrin superfamily protein